LSSHRAVWLSRSSNIVTVKQTLNVRVDASEGVVIVAQLAGQASEDRRRRLMRNEVRERPPSLRDDNPLSRRYAFQQAGKVRLGFIG
jgi:ribosomal 50S subunit-recycling heat shock protein